MAAEGLQRLVPDRRLALNGSVVGPELAAKITRITVELSDGVFNECRIVLNDADLKLIGGKELMGGVAVQVELGFQGKLHPVFDGEIVAVEPRFVRDQPPSVVVRALEPLHRLALAPKTRSFQEVTTAQIVSQVAKEHGLSGTGPSGGAPAHLLQPNITDYTLLRKIAARTGHRIHLEGKKLTVGPPPNLGEVEVKPGDGVKRLKVALRTSEQVPKVVVRGWDWKQKKEIVGQAQPTGEAKDGADAAKPFGVTEFFIEGILVHDTAEAQAIAKATVQSIAERYAVAKGELVDNAEVQPGKVLAFDKMGELLDGKYRVQTARHEFDKRGYRVFFEATRVAKKKTTAKFKAPPTAHAHEERRGSKKGHDGKHEGKGHEAAHHGHEAQHPAHPAHEGKHPAHEAKHHPQHPAHEAKHHPHEAKHHPAHEHDRKHPAAKEKVKVEFVLHDADDPETKLNQAHVEVTAYGHKHEGKTGGNGKFTLELEGHRGGTYELTVKTQGLDGARPPDEPPPGHHPHPPGPSQGDGGTTFDPPNEVTVHQLREIMPDAAHKDLEDYVRPLNKAMREFHLNNPRRQAAFIAQIAHETGQLRWKEEIASGAEYQGILGNTHPGDGVKYKGRGLIQVTGRDNYASVGRALHLDLLDHPRLLDEPINSCRASCYWWYAHHLNGYADRGEFLEITRIINGGYNGLADREMFWARAKRVLGNSDK